METRDIHDCRVTREFGFVAQLVGVKRGNIAVAASYMEISSIKQSFFSQRIICENGRQSCA